MRKKKQHEEEHVDESWLIPYADLLTLLLALFIVLFAMSEIDAKKFEEMVQVFNNEFSGGEGILEHSGSAVELPEKTSRAAENQEHGGREELEQLQKLQDDINRYIEENNLSDVLGTSFTHDGLLLSILNDVTFTSGSAEVSEEGKQMAQEISPFLQTDPPHEVLISGHTDNRPIGTSDFSSNWELSAMRALNFMGLLLNDEKLDSQRFSVKGYGEHKPIAPNDSKKNMAKNRRVEVLILPNYKLKDTEEKS